MRRSLMIFASLMAFGPILVPSSYAANAPAAEAQAAPAPQNNVMTALQEAEEGHVFTDLLRRADMQDVLSDGKMRHTIFMPSDDAFDDYDEAKLKQLKYPDNKQALVAFLKGHIVNGYITRKALDNNSSQVMTSNRGRLRVIGKDGKLRVNDFKVNNKELSDENTVVFVIDHVIEGRLPKMVALPEGYVEEAAPAPEAVQEAKTPEKTPANAAPAKKKPWYKFW